MKSRKNNQVFIVIAMAIVIFLNTASINGQETKTLKSGTKIFVQTERYFTSGAAQVGDHVNMSVRYDVKVDNKVVIPKGTEVIGRVVHVEDPMGTGQGGEIRIEAESIMLSSEEEVRLSGSPYVAVGKNKETEACLIGLAGCVLLPVVGIVAYFFYPGEDAVINGGTPIDTYVAEDIKLHVIQ